MGKTILFQLDEKAKVAVFGGGSWATAIVKILLNNVEKIGWYVRDPEVADSLKKDGRNSKYLSSVKFDKTKLVVSTDINEIAKNADVIVFAIPSAFLKDSLQDLNVSLDGKFIISAIKGIIPDDNQTVAEFFNTHYKIPFDFIGIVTGPCHAEEAALERLSYLTVACKNRENAAAIAEKLNCSFINTVTSTDIYGTEYSAVLKNIYSIAAGICHGIGYGDNFQAVLISNAQREIKRFLDQTYPSKRNIDSSAYLGDLLVTAYSHFSRNRTFGTMIGRGYSVKAAQLEMSMVAEGYYSTACIKEINKKYNVKLPIVDAMYNILYEGIAPAIEIKLLTEKLK